MAIREGKIITVTSVKGGTGKTTTLLNIAGSLSKYRQKILILDLDLYGSGIGVSLKVDPGKDVYQLSNDLSNNHFKNIDDYITSYNENIDIIPGPIDPRLANRFNSRYLGVIFSRLTVKYDLILVDTNHIMDEINLITFDLSDLILYVMSNNPVDIKNMKSMVSIFKDMGKSNYKIILNNALDKTKNHFSNYDIKNIINNNIHYIIPNDFFLRNIDGYILDGTILTLSKRINAMHPKVVSQFDEIAKDIMKMNGR